MTLIERLRSGEPYDSLVKEAVADRLEQAEKLIAELTDTLGSIADCTQDNLSAKWADEALASAKAWKEGT